jgi:hypothetical protein
MIVTTGATIVALITTEENMMRVITQPAVPSRCGETIIAERREQRR